jgi:hypothetical protein
VPSTGGRAQLEYSLDSVYAHKETKSILPSPAYKGSLINTTFGLGGIMRCHRNHIGLLALAGSLMLTGPAVAQKQPMPGDNQPLLTIVMPNGGKAGSTAEVTVTGLQLDEPQGLLFSEPGFKAQLVTVPTAEKDTKKPDGQRGNQAQRRGNPNNSQVMTHKYKVSIPQKAALGIHDVRIVTKAGVSNPRAFVVGDLAEVLEQEPNNDVPQAQRVELNTTVSGTISSATDVDYFVFSGKKGQRVVISCLASSIDSRLQPGLEIYDQAGKLLAFNKNYNGADALTDVTLPADGDYYVRVFEYTYTLGGPEYFYRLSVTTAPWIDAVFPPVVEPGKAARLTVHGRNLPGGELDPSAVIEGRVLEKISVTVNVPSDPRALQQLAFNGYVAPNASGLDGFEYRLRNDAGTSNPFLLTYAKAPVVLDNENNDTPETAQEVTLPCEIAGRIEKKGDRDWYTFAAKKGDVYSIEVYGDRLGSPLDMYFVLRNPGARGGNVEMDDNPEIMNPVQFFTRTDDPPVYRFVAPEDGKYQLLVTSRDAAVQAGPRQLYRVRITPEQPDFRLVVMPQAQASPDACVLRQGSRQYFTVFVWRQDSWNDEINLSADGLPPGVTCPPQKVGPGLHEATLVVSATAEAKDWTGPITIKGTGVVNGANVEREARGATITWPAIQQNIPTISRLDHGLVLAVRAAKALFTLTAGIDKVQAQPGERVTIPVKLQRLAPDFKLPVQLTVLNLPTQGPRNRGNRNNLQMTINPGKDDANVVVDLRPNVAPGTYSVVIRGEAQAQPNRGNRPVPTSLVQASEPITLTVLPRQLVKIAVTPETPMVTVGKDTEVVVKVTRMNDYQGKLRLELVAPKGAGISAEEVVVPAGKSEAKLVLRASGKAPRGEKPELCMRATATGRDGTPVTQEVRFNVKVAK